MGWRDRDYAKFNDDERRVFLGGGRSHRLPPSDEGSSHPGLALRPIERQSGRRSHRSNPVVLLAAAVSLAAVIFVGYAKNVPVLHDLLTPSLTHAPKANPI